MRITLKRTILTAFGTIAMLCLVHYLNLRKQGNNSCFLPPAYQSRLIKLSEKVHKTLELLQSTHFLCHESLWASLYNDGPRSWDRELELCLVGVDFLEQDEGFIKRIFKSQDLTLDYDMMEGVYWVKFLENQGPHIPKTAVSNESDVVAKLFLFKQNQQSLGMMMRKTGFKRALLPEDCENELLECIPRHLTLTPLPHVKYGHVTLPAPREGIEIQKYHYPNDWWLQRKIPPC